MTIAKLIKELERLNKQLIEGLDDWQDLTGYAREQAYIKIESAIEVLEENEE